MSYKISDRLVLTIHNPLKYGIINVSAGFNNYSKEMFVIGFSLLFISIELKWYHYKPTWVSSIDL